MSDKPIVPLPLDKDQIPVLTSREAPVPLREDQIPGGGVENRPSTTTVEQDRVTSGQRRVNLLWEATQAFVALAVVLVTLYADTRVALGTFEITTNQLAALMQLNVMMSLVIGFYFSRTNHTAIGGTGSKPSQEYIGR